MFFDSKPPLPNWVGYQCKRHKLTTGKERTMYLTLDMLMDPMFWLPLPVFVFFLGGKLSPLSQTKWYRKFYKSIGL